MVSFLKTNLHEYFYAQKSGQNDKHILHDLAMTALRYLFSVLAIIFYWYIQQHGYILYITWSKKNKYQRKPTIWFRLYEVQKQAKLIYGFETQTLATFGGGEGGWTGEFLGVLVMFCF